MKEKRTLTVKIYSSPFGQLLLGSINDRLCLCDWRTERHSLQIDERIQRRLTATYQEGTSRVIAAAQHQLDEYFAGTRQTFELPLILAGTDFQQQVWKELLQIPYGTTLSYAEIARRTGKPTAVRAVANANHANPLSVIIPCHRVIGSNHKLTGYGGGLAVKRQLLNLECPVINRQVPFSNQHNPTI